MAIQNTGLASLQQIGVTTMANVTLVSKQRIWLEERLLLQLERHPRLERAPCASTFSM